MNTKLSEDLRELLQHKDGLCASLIIPLQKVPGGTSTDRLEIRHILEKLRSKLSEMNHQDSVLLEKAEKLCHQAAEIKGEHGAGIFVSYKLEKLLTFPFEVKEKVVLDKSFEVREAVQRQRYLQDYYILLIGGSGSRLFKASENRYEEISDQNFPASFDGLDYEIPIQENQGDDSKKTLKRDVGVTIQNPKAYYNLIDEKLNSYLTPEVPLFVAGAGKEPAGYKNQSVHKIAGSVQGSFDNNTLNQLKEKGREALHNYLKLQELELLERLKETGRQFISAGIRDVWYDAHQGKGSLLLVEHDLEQPAFIGENKFDLQLQPGKGEQKSLTDAVDDVVEAVLEKNGTVVFVENGSLKEYNGIVLENRY
jgi:hypothetical protein